MSKSTTSVATIESKILAILEKADAAVGVDALVKQLAGTPPERAEEALWNLLDRNEIEYTKDWKLRRTRQLVAA
jgi:hypothetical protein